MTKAFEECVAKPNLKTDTAMGADRYDLLPEA